MPEETESNKKIAPGKLSVAVAAKADILATILIVICIAFTLVYFYVRGEAPCYWSDFNSYEWAARFSLNSLAKDALFYPILLLGSVSLQHNLFFTAPLTPIMAALGATRLAYIAATTITYLLPYTFLLALTFRQLLSSKSQQKLLPLYWLIILLLPVAWAPCLRGYPDDGAALTLWLALYLYLQNRSFSEPKKAARLGFLLALTVLLRRYFAFAGVALIATICLDQLIMLKSAPSGPTIKSKARSFAALVGGGALTMICLGFPFLQNLTRLNLGALYDSYHVEAATSLAYFFSCFGLILWLLSLTGYGLALVRNIVDREKICFVLVFLISSEALWVLGPGELGTHYTIYFLPLIALGVVLLFASIFSLTISSIKKWAIVAPLLLFLIFNCALSLLPAKLADRSGLTLFRPGMLSYADQEGRGAGLLFSAGYAPNVREDMVSLQEIVKELRPHFPPDTHNKNTDINISPLLKRGQVAVLASSNLLNSEVLRNTERSLYGLYNDTIPWLELPVVDSKDSYPLERLIACQYIVVPSKELYFIPPSGQTLLRSALHCFDDQWPLGTNFTPLPGKYELDGGVTVRILDRYNSTTPSVAALTLQKFRDYVGKEPGSQPDWTTTGQLSQICYDKNRDRWLFAPGLAKPGFFCDEVPYLLYNKSLDTDKLRSGFCVSGKITVSGESPATTVRAQVLDKAGNILARFALLAPSQPGKRATNSFSHDFSDLIRAKPNQPPAFLALEVDNAPQAISAAATTVLSDLVVAPSRP